MSVMHQYSKSRGSHYTSVMCVILFHLFHVVKHLETALCVSWGLAVCLSDHLPFCHALAKPFLPVQSASFHMILPSISVLYSC